MSRAAALAFALLFPVAHSELAHAGPRSCADTIDKDSAIVLSRPERIEGGTKCWVRPKDGGDESVHTIIWDEPTLAPEEPPKSTCTAEWMKKKWKDNPACTSTTAPPGEEKTARCTQQPAQKRTKAEADVESARNVAMVKGAAGWKTIRGDYNKIRMQIENEEILPAKEEKEAKQSGKAATPKTRADAFPVFGPKDMCPKQPITDVNIGIPCGTYEADFAAANNIAGLAATPSDCVWHHHQEMGRMQLVRKSAHKEFHWGGLAIWRRLFDLPDYPLCCPPKS